LKVDCYTEDEFKALSTKDKDKYRKYAAKHKLRRPPPGYVDDPSKPPLRRLPGMDKVKRRSPRLAIS